MGQKRSLCFYAGGFSSIGGIEQFAYDFLTETAGAFAYRELICWGRPLKHLPLLQAIQDSGTTIKRSFWRWGCRWAIPDQILTPSIYKSVKRCDLTVFAKPLTPQLSRILAKVKRSTFVYVTAYRPSEFFKNQTDIAALGIFDLIITQTAGFASDLRQLGYCGRIEVIPLFPPSTLPISPFPKDPQVIKIGFLGRLEEQKNVIYLLNAFAALRALDPQINYKLEIFGDGSQAEILKRASCELNLRRSVNFNGRKSRDDINACIDSCHLFTYPSITEGQNLGALEVLSRGRPLAATPVGSHVELLQNPLYGRIVPLGDPEEYARILKSLADDVIQQRVDPVTISSTYGQQFSRARIRQQYIDCLSSIIK